MKAEWAAIAATVLLRAAAIVMASRSAVPWIDPDGYLSRAVALSSSPSSWLAALADSEGLLVPPLYAAWLSALATARASPQVILLVQALLAGVSCAAMIGLARSIAGPRAALLAGWVFALTPTAIVAAPAFWSEALFVPLSCAALALLAAAMETPSSRSFAASGLVFGAAALTRTPALYAGAAICVVIAVREPAMRRGVMIFGGVFVAIVAAYVAAASAQAGRPILVDNSAEWHWRARLDPEGARDAPVSSVPAALVREFSASPVRALRESAARVRATFGGGEWHGATAAQFPARLLTVLHGVNVVLIVAMVALAVRGVALTRRSPVTFMLVTWITVQLMLTALSATNASPRYRAPIEPALLALAAAACRRI